MALHLSRAALVSSALAVALAGLSGSAALAAASAHHAPAATGGKLVAWGANAAGQLGNGTMSGSDTPVKVKVARGTRIVQTRAGCFFTVALTSAGEVLAWGENENGQLGDNSLKPSAKPVRVHIPADLKIVQVKAGCAFALALTSGGQVLAWGLNFNGQLGDRSPDNSLVPTMVRLPRHTRVTGISAGLAQSLAVTGTGQVLAWGDNEFGQLGNGHKKDKNVPVSVRLPAKTKVTAVAAGGTFSLAQTSKGGVLAWGENNVGELGDASMNGSDVPVAVSLPAGTRVTQIYGGDQHALALTSTGAVLAWGYNAFGQLGDASKNNSDVPVSVQLPPGTKAVQIAAGQNHSLALTSKGRVLAWGDNTSGQLGDGNDNGSDVPVSVQLSAKVRITRIASGPEASISLAIEAS